MEQEQEKKTERRKIRKTLPAGYRKARAKFVELTRRYITTSEAMEMMSCGRRALEAYRDKGMIRCSRPGLECYWNVDDMNLLLENSVVNRGAWEERQKATRR